jgi:homogentisate 1,2-dioxygenase
MSTETFENLSYINGFGAAAESEALPGALPIGQNTPQLCPYGLYAEQLSGTAFTAPRHKNFRTWLYRIRPSVLHYKLVARENQHILDAFQQLQIEPNQLRWGPESLVSEDKEVDFIDGLKVMCGSGDPAGKSGVGIYVYAANKSMENKAFYNSDGDWLIVPQTGTLYVQTEMGRFTVEPCEIIVIPRGVKFSVHLTASSRGYVAEVFDGHFEIPGLGPIGANGLANPRDFQFPKAAFDTPSSTPLTFTLVNKFMHKIFETTMPHSPFDVVAWHGNYLPYKYDLRRFNTVNTVSFDHLDPSIFTVLTCQSNDPGTAVMDFVIFPPRWMVAQNTFRPPYYHRNCMSEYMGMIWGKYDAKVASAEDGKQNTGFVPGGSSLHSCMTSHGPDAASFVKGSTGSNDPVYFGEGLAFMFESCYLLKVSKDALEGETLQRDYSKCWHTLPTLFTGERNPAIDWDGLKDKLLPKPPAK